MIEPPICSVYANCIVFFKLIYHWIQVNVECSSIWHGFTQVTAKEKKMCDSSAGSSVVYEMVPSFSVSIIYNVWITAISAWCTSLETLKICICYFLFKYKNLYVSTPSSLKPRQNCIFSSFNGFFSASLLIRLWCGRTLVSRLLRLPSSGILKPSGSSMAGV